MRQILRKIAAMFALVGISMTLVPSAMAATYTAQAAADKLAADGYIVYQSNSAAYRLADNLLRQEAVGTAGKVLGIIPDEDPAGYDCQGNVFSDITSSTEKWVCRAAELAAEAGLTNASNANFRPKDKLTNFEALVFALRAGELLEDGLTQSAIINLGVENGVITSAAGFNANALATRGAFFQYTARAMDATPAGDDLCQLFGTCGTDVPPVTPPTGGNVSVGLSPSSPASRFTPKSAQNVVFAAFDFVGGSTATTITSLKLNRTGVGSRNDFSGVYLRSNNIALTNERTVNSDNLVEFGNLNIAVPAGQKVTVEVVANMSTSTPSSNSQNAFTIMSASMIGSNGTVVGNFPVSGNLMTMSAIGVATLKVTSTVKASDPSLGQTNAVLGTLKLENDDANSTDHRVKLVSMALEQAGTIDASAIDNLGLYDGSTKVAAQQTRVGDDYILVFNPDYILNDGNSKTLELRGDIVAGKANDTIVFALNDNSDFVAVDVDANGVGAYVHDEDGTDMTDFTTFGSATYYIDGDDSADALTLKAGDVTLSFNGPATKDIAWGDKDVILLESTLSSTRNIEVKAMDLKLTLTKGNGATVDSTAIKNIKIMDDQGSTLMGPVSDLVAFGFVAAGTGDDGLADEDTDSVETKNFTDSFYVNAGQSRKLRVVAELSSTADTDLTDIAAEIQLDADTYVKDTTTNKYLTASTSITPTAISGKTHNIVNNSLTLATASSPAAATVVKGTKDVKAGGLSLKAGDAGALTVKSIKFTFGGTDAATAKSIYTNARLVDANGVVLDTSNITDAATDTVTFDGFSYVVGKGATQVVYIVVDVLDSVTASKVLSLGVASTSDITVVEADGDTLATGNISGVPTTGNSMTIDTAGTFTVSPLTVDSRNLVVQSGTVGKEVARYEFNATKEKFNVKKLTFNYTGDSEIIKSMKLKIGAVEKVESSITGGEVTFSSINAEVEGTVQVSLFADFQAMDSRGNDTGKTAHFELAQDNDSTETEVVGSGSSTTINDLAAFTDSTTNKTYTARKTKLTFAKTTTGLVSKLDLAASDATVYLTTIQNSSGSSVDLGKVKFDLSQTDSDGGEDLIVTDLKLYVNGSEVTTSEATYSAKSGRFDVINGGLDIDEDGDVDASDDASNLAFASEQFDVIDGQIDVNEDGAITAADDLSNVVLASEQFDVIDGQIDVNEDAAIDGTDDASNLVAEVTDLTITFNSSNKGLLSAGASLELKLTADIASEDGDSFSVDVVDDDSGASNTATKGFYNIVNGEFDIDRDGTTNSDSADDGTIVINGTSYTIKDGQVDVNGDDTTNSQPADDLTGVTINGNTYNIVNGQIDIDGIDGGADDANDDLTVSANFIWSDKAAESHGDNTLDWANGYGLNMDVLTNNSFSNEQ